MHCNAVCISADSALQATNKPGWVSAAAGCLNKVVNHRTSRTRDEVNSWCVSAGSAAECQSGCGAAAGKT